jgi:hypothetical protein
MMNKETKSMSVGTLGFTPYVASQDCTDTLACIFSKFVGDNIGPKLHLHHENCNFFTLPTLGTNSS